MIWTVTFNPSRDVTVEVAPPLVRGRIFRSRPPIVRLGGKGNNVARIVRRLGSEVAAVGFYGGAIGEGLVAALAQAGVPTLVGRAGETRSCLTILDGGGATTEIREPGPVVEPRSADALLACFIRRVRPGDWVGLSGSLPPGLPPETWGTWIRALKPRVAGAVVDTAGEGLQIALAAGPTLLTPNAAEWRELAMEAPDVAVAVTEGSRGVIWQPARGSRVLWTPSQVPVRNAVGDGDAFVGGLLWRLARGEGWESALPWAVAVATASCLTVGVADIDPEMVSKIRAGVRRETPAKADRSP